MKKNFERNIKKNNFRLKKIQFIKLPYSPIFIMLKYICTIVLIMCLILNASASEMDSLGIEKRNGLVLVQHKVEKGETLYMLLKRYNCTEKEYFSINFEKKNSTIRPNDVIEIPFHTSNHENRAENSSARVDENGIEIIDVPEATPKETSIVRGSTIKKDSSKVKVQKPKTIAKTTQTHLVADGENLFSISKKYQLKPWQIREWNELKSDILHPNQLLYVSKPAHFIEKFAKKDSLKTKITSVQAPAGDWTKENKSNKNSLKTPIQVAPTQIPNAPGGKKVKEQGIAEIIDTNIQSSKYLALHRSAPIGTLIKIQNQANDKSVWVKVIGKLQIEGDVMIKVSPVAFEKLSPKDKRIRAEITYSLSN